MRRINKITTLLLALVMVLMMSQAAMAETYDGGTYSFNGSAINNTKAAAAIDQAIAGLQPGDSMDFTFTYKNDSKDSTEWYLENIVVKTLEEADAKGGGYTYELVNDGQKEGHVVIFSSKAVAGYEAADPDKSHTGLTSATNATQDWLYIDTLAPGQSGKTTLRVALDGESQANAYENRSGQLRIAYAVEKTAVGETVYKTKNVKTGDETNLIMPILMFLGAAILLILAILSFRRDRKDGEEA